ncbi:uncharacterized protein NPIL_560191 [Nephila pilipes]|uniref:BPTI/Kunitz inhibitor domain-containing protein n=1 Tax=Nephila pilipes TaxID=299642 RepID=A0A8X6MCU5_NEPPI|nr:uncharacterized protein NPIL_560191 [Nephila pilipes]
MNNHIAPDTVRYYPFLGYSLYSMKFEIQQFWRSCSRKCKYASIKVIRNLFPVSGIKENDMLTITTDADCDSPLFKMVKGVALLMSNKVIEPNSVITLDDETVMVGILPGSTTIYACPQNKSIYFNLEADDSSIYQTFNSSYTPDQPVINPPVPSIYNDPLPDHQIIDDYVTEPTYPGTTITYKEPAVVDSSLKDKINPIFIRKPSFFDKDIANEVASNCVGHMDQSCPVCGEINSLPSEVYCNAKLTLLARTIGHHYVGALGTLYDITADKIPVMAVLRVLYSIPPGCYCPSLQGDGYLLIISEESVPLTNPLSLKLTRGMHIYPADRGRTSFPPCFFKDPIQPRSKVSKNIIELEPVDKELRDVLPELSNTTCPTIDHTCPKCGGMSDEKLEELICSAEEVLLVSRNETSVKKYEHTCTFPLEKGNCTRSIPRFYYDAEDEMCNEFSYSGCHGNANNFQSYEQCEDNCLYEDFCMQGNLNIEKIIKSSDDPHYLSNELTYTFPEHCDCPHVFQENIQGYLISERQIDDNDVSIQLSQNYHFVPLSGDQKRKKFACILDHSPTDATIDATPSDVQIKNLEPKKKKKKWGIFR